MAASRVVEPRALARITLDQTLLILSAERAFLFLPAAWMAVPPPPLEQQVSVGTVMRYPSRTIGVG